MSVCDNCPLRAICEECCICGSATYTLCDHCEWPKVIVKDLEDDVMEQYAVVYRMSRTANREGT